MNPITHPTPETKVEKPKQVQVKSVAESSAVVPTLAVKEAAKEPRKSILKSSRRDRDSNSAPGGQVSHDEIRAIVQELREQW